MPAADLEERHRLYRWGWMLDDGEGAYAADTLADYMIASDARMAANPPHPYWESYSLAERIVTAILLCAWYRGLPRRDAIEPLLIRSGALLLSRLEYYGPRTNNHLLNDARALYVLGATAGVPAFAAAGRTILEHELPRMVPDGVLREGSSHYHLLAARWIADVAWSAAGAGDERFAATLEDVLASMSDAGALFADPTRPCVTAGDVSPDITLERLQWTTTQLHGRRWPPAERAEPALRRRGEWCRWTGGAGVSLLWRLPADPTPPYPTHAHSDLGAPLLWVRGRAVLVDPGRLDYTGSPLGRYGAGASAHSALLLDGLGAIPEPAGPFSSRDLVPVRCEITAHGTADGCRVDLAHDGFARIQRGTRHRRTFEVASTSLRIDDRLDGTGTHDISILFQIAPDVDLKRHSDQEWVLDPNGLSIRLVLAAEADASVRSQVLRAVDTPAPAGWVFPNYGERTPAVTLRFELVGVRLPVGITTNLSWN